MAFSLVVAVGLVLVVAQCSTLWSFPQVLFHSNEGGVITPQLSTFIKHTLALENITGLSVAVVSKHGHTELHTWGDRTEDGDEVTPDTLFHMASVSKAFCATAVGLLIDDFANGNNVTALPPGLNELTWHTRLSDLLPDWQLMDKWTSERANLRDILSHVSGMPRHDTSYGPSDTPQEVITRLKYLRPAFELREQWSYNNIMYMIAGHVVATYSGRSYASFVEDRIFTPLGMTSSTFSLPKAEASGKFTQGWTGKSRRLPTSFPEGMNSTILDGPGGVISNAVDMSRWISMWIGQGVHDNQVVIPMAVYQNVTCSYAVATGLFAVSPNDPERSIVGYGMGWFRNSYRGHDVVYHAGALPWASTLVSFLPTDEIGVTLFANGEGKAESLNLILNRILDSALDLTNPWTLTSPPSSKVTTTELGAQNLTLSLDAFTGLYTNPGYGSFTLCSPSSASSYCTRVHSYFSSVDGAQDNPGSTDLLAEWPRVWSSHVRLRHQHGPIFKMYFTSLYPNGYGKDTTPFETCLIEAVVEFVVENGEVVGFGMADLVDQLTERARKHRTVQDRAEVWFDRVRW